VEERERREKLGLLVPYIFLSLLSSILRRKRIKSFGEKKRGGSRRLEAAAPRVCLKKKNPGRKESGRERGGGKRTEGRNRQSAPATFPIFLISEEVGGGEKGGSKGKGGKGREGVRFLTIAPGKNPDL